VIPVETTLAWVFLTGRFAYKLKKSIRHTRMDFSPFAADFNKPKTPSPPSPSSINRSSGGPQSALRREVGLNQLLLSPEEGVGG
jgi:hypothetical protein